MTCKFVMQSYIYKNHQNITIMAKCTGYWFVERIFANNFSKCWSAKPVFDALKIHKKLSVLKQSLQQFKPVLPAEQSMVNSCVKVVDSVATWKQFETLTNVEVTPAFAESMPSYVCLSNFDDKATYDRFVAHHEQEVANAKAREAEALEQDKPAKKQTRRSKKTTD